jgi:uncharacterized membrane protein
MTPIVHSVEVLVPARTAYEHWACLEQLPRFLHGVREVRRLDERRQLWRVRLGGLGREFEAAIVEQTPDQRIAWQSLRGALHSGDVTFERLGDAVCRITVRIDYAPSGLVEILGSVLGVPSRAVRQDLRRFAAHVRAHVAAGGAAPVQLAWVVAAE